MNTSTKYTYYFRPGYGSDELLIEFLTGIDKPEDHAPFIAMLLNAVDSLKPSIDNMEDVFVNDEYWYTIGTKQGKVLLTINVWGMAFILAQDNQSTLQTINQLLQQDVCFERIDVDFEKYRKL